MSTKEPSGHHQEQRTLNIGEDTGESQELSAPKYSDDSSQEQRLFQQEPSVEDLEGVAWRRGTSRPHSKKWRVLWVSLVLLLLGSIVAAFMVVPRLYRIDTAVSSATNQTLPKVHTTQHAVVIPIPAALPKDLASLDHLNLLLLASDTDAKFAGGGVLTQTDMVVRIDFTHHHVTMLSLPRDLWIPSDMGYCCNKLDEISLNETDNATTPLDIKLHGFAHTVATVEQDFHVPINTHAWVGLDGFITIKQEGVRILIENGSQDEAAGDKLSKVLTKDGFIVLNVQPADHPYLATQIENFNPRTANTSFILAQLFGVLASTPGTAASYGVDIIIILGQDSAASVEATG